MKSDDRNPSPIGLIAGWGRFPVQVAQKIKDQSHPVVAVAITGHASHELESICDEVLWSGVGKLGKHLRFFQRCKANKITMAGKLFKADLLYQGSVWLRHFPDLTCIRTLGPCLLGSKRDARDDQLLLAITAAYKRWGMEIFPATDVAPELLVTDGLLAGPRVSKQSQQDTEFGWRIAKQMGAMDIGQAVTIKDGIVIAVEAIEGTDACIERTGKLCKRGGWTLVKVSKPSQDMRFDVPTIGPQTIQMVSDAGGKNIAIEADKTIVVDQEVTYRLASRLGISILSLNLESGTTETQGCPPRVKAA
ncbi:MAG: LpxI family protein [Rubripirellula sp.]